MGFWGNGVYDQLDISLVMEVLYYLGDLLVMRNSPMPLHRVPQYGRASPRLLIPGFLHTADHEIAWSTP